MILEREAIAARDLTLKLLPELFPNTHDFGVRLWDGTTWPDTGPHRATLVLNHPGALRAMLMQGTEQGMVEAYLYDDVDIEGRVELVVDAAEHLANQSLGWGSKLRLGKELLLLPNQANPRQSIRGPAQLKGERHSLERDRQAIAYHYNVGNDFYALFLDRRMIYSCAYFQTPQDDLDSAQEQKLAHICRKLRLRPGQRLLDIGCGWGGLAMYAAEHWGVQADGVTLSEPQAVLANQVIAQAGLQKRASVRLQDYRQIRDSDGYDAVVSVGMVEHVGADRLPEFFAQAYRLLKPGGVFLCHGIASRAADPPIAAHSLSAAYVFPDGELTPISYTLRCAEEQGFEVRDVESLRDHYKLTLRHWVQNLEKHHERAADLVDEVTYRVWRLYMAGSAHGFAHGRLNVYQSLLLKPRAGGNACLPLTRADWYE